MSGLTAAYRLADSGHAVTALEAQHRVGGRVRSVTLENGAVAELGGEWIENDQQHIAALAGEFGVSMSPVGVDFARRDLIGRPPIPDSEHRRVAEVVNGIVAALTEAERRGATAAGLLTEADDGSDAFTVLRQRLEGSAGVPLERVAVDEVVGDFGLGGSSYVRIDDGNEALARAIADALPDVRTGRPVHGIEVTDNSVLVHAEGVRLTADAVVVAVPLPLISLVRFDPPLHSELVDVLSSLPMGTAAKFVAATESTPPLLARQSADATWWCWTGAGEGGATRSAVSGFAGTPAAIEAVSRDWAEALSEAVPEVARGHGRFVDWGREAWFGGCYSALGPDDDRLRAFEVPGRVVFAGEHTLGAGTIDGAIESGERAAARVKRLVGAED